MTRIILLLIIVVIVLPGRPTFSWATADSLSNPSESSRESVESEKHSLFQLGMIEYNKGNVELAKAFFQRSWESLENEKVRLRSSPQDAAVAKVQFPKGYKVNVYYRDGWYLQPKANEEVGQKKEELSSYAFNLQSSFQKERVYSFLPDSTYKIRVEIEDEHPPYKEINFGMKVIAALVMISWVMAR